MQFNSVKRGNFSGLASSVNRNADAIFKAARDTAVDNTAIAKEAIKGRSMERRAAMEAEGKVAQAGLKAFANVKDTKNKIESAEKINDIKRPAKRMAGVVAGLGALSGAALMHKNLKEDKAERAAYKAELEAYNTRWAEMRAEGKAADEALQEQLTKLTESFKTPPEPPKPSGSGTNTSGSTPAPSPSPSGGSLKLTPGKPITQAQGTQLLIDQGMDPENARIGGAVMMAESRGKPGALNSNNEYSLGLWQHNRDTGEDRHNFYGIKDWSELSDPETNARATYRLWKRQGGWEPWGAFTNGSYKDFL